MTLEFKVAGEDDEAFVYRAKKLALGPLIESKFGWHEEFQRLVHEHDWQNRPWSIIHKDGVAIGTVSIDRREEVVRLGGFYLLPEYQNQGTGTRILEKVLYTLDRDQRDCRIRLLVGNPALNLFKRLGFREVGHDELHTDLLRNWRVP